MGSPIHATPADRLATRTLAAAVLEATREDEAMPHGLRALRFNYLSNDEVYDKDDVEALIAQLCGEIVALVAERDRAMHIVEADCDNIPPLDGDLDACAACGVQHFVARVGIDREAWNVAMHNLGEQKMRADALAAKLAEVEKERDEARDQTCARHADQKHGADLEARDEKLAAVTKERDHWSAQAEKARINYGDEFSAHKATKEQLDTALASLAVVTAERDEARAIGHDAIDKANRYMSEADAARAESERLRTELAAWKEEHVEICAQRAEWLADRDAAVAESERLRTALTKISAIRDSIVGMQGFNFSEHAYPLVAALGEAGFDGAGYEIARKNLGTLIEQRDAADAESERLRGEVERLALTADEREALGVLRFLLGKHSHEPYAYEGEDVETALAALDKLIGGGK